MILFGWLMETKSDPGPGALDRQVFANALV